MSEEDKEGLLCIKLPPITCECKAPDTPDGPSVPDLPDVIMEGTLKDKFAMHAMTGLLSGNDVILNPQIIPDLVDAAYNIADQMLAERIDPRGHRRL